MTRRPCAEALYKYGQSLNVKALTAELARIDDEREEMLKALKKSAEWLHAWPTPMGATLQRTMQAILDVIAKAETRA